MSKDILDGLKPTGLIIGGRVVPCCAPVYNWYDTGLEVKIGGNNKARGAKQEIDLFVVHWTGGFGDAAALFRVLSRRTLGVEYFIDYAGRVVQYCDPILVNTADAGFVNPRSVGVEVQCAGYPPDNVRRHVVGQDHYRDKIRRRTIDMVDFTKEQKISLYELIEAHRGAMHPLITIPATIPRGTNGKLLQETMTPREVRNYSGVIGHYHISTNKTDPGTRPLLYLDAKGYR